MTLKNYTLIRSIGEGGFGRVFLANRNGEENSFVAIKIQKKEAVEKSFWSKQFAINEIQLGAIHNDLKPSNVLINGRGYAVVCDFGLSVIGQSDTGAKGTKGYIAPECFSKEKYSASADYFSLGVILYELSEKRHPFKDNNDMKKGIKPALKRKF
ncbi:uncharacterized protein [Chironomus tepperi]|uniref:uncharacterized protein n=1 Tax=Chironomus tepperi TaxID=113505 RepID=UPI00391F0050